MATQILITSNTSPTVEVYRIQDGANSYILAQDGASTGAPTALSVQIDYSNAFDRIADALEGIGSVLATIDSRINGITLSLSQIADNSNVNTVHLNTIADHYEVERAMNVSDLKNGDFYDEGTDKFEIVSEEIKNPTQFE